MFQETFPVLPPGATPHLSHTEGRALTWDTVRSQPVRVLLTWDPWEKVIESSLNLSASLAMYWPVVCDNLRSTMTITQEVHVYLVSNNITPFGEYLLANRNMPFLMLRWSYKTFFFPAVFLQVSWNACPISGTQASMFVLLSDRYKAVVCNPRAVVKSPEGLVETQVAEPLFQSLWFSRSDGESENYHFSQVARRCCEAFFLGPDLENHQPKRIVEVYAFERTQYDKRVSFLQEQRRENWPMNYLH